VLTTTRLAALLGSFVLRLRARQRISVPSGTVKINLGSGLVVAPGWLNFDASLNAMSASFPAWFLPYFYRLSGERHQLSRDDYVGVLRNNRFVHHDVSFGIPLNDKSADFVYSSHMLEHLLPAAAERLLREVYRVLKPGGIVRICIPDLEFAVSKYLHGDRDTFLAYFFPLDKRNDFGWHRYMYDFWMLEQMLLATGFRNIRRLGPAVGATPDIELLDNRPQETLFVEANK
jgi:SAM-dependent methyltransferase